MPRAHTEQFGDLEYSEDATLEFPHGLPGFELAHRFVLLDQPELAPLVHLQSLEFPGLCFLALPIRVIDDHYQLDLSDEDRRTLGLGGLGFTQTLDLALLSVAYDGRVTANLLAPVVVNLATRRAVQAVRLDTRYSHQHVLEEATACS